MGKFSTNSNVYPWKSKILNRVYLQRLEFCVELTIRNLKSQYNSFSIVDSHVYIFRLISQPVSIWDDINLLQKVGLNQLNSTEIGWNSQISRLMMKIKLKLANTRHRFWYQKILESRPLAKKPLANDFKNWRGWISLPERPW